MSEADEKRGWSARSVVGCFALATLAGFAFFVCLVAPNLIIHTHPHSPDASAIGSLKTIAIAEVIFREGDKDENGALDYGSLAQLSQAQLVDGLLGAGTKMGYQFRVRPSASTSEFLWFATATPVTPTVTGDRYFCTNHAGVIFYTRTGPFAMNTTDCAIPANAVPVGK